MVCVDRKRFKCICGCDLTTSTLIYGILFIIGGLGSIGGMSGIGIFGFFQIIMGILMCITITRKKSVSWRRMIYKLYVAYCIILLIIWIIVLILVIAVDSITEDAIEDASYYSYYYSSYSYGSYYNYSGSVDDAVKTLYIIVMIIWACIYFPITLIGLQIVYWGWKEQE